MASKPKAKPAAKKTSKKGATKKSGSGKTTLIMVITTLVLVVVFKLGFLFFVLGILPSIVSYYIDATRSNLSFQTVFTCNLAGVLPFMAQMLQSQDSNNSAVHEIITNSVNWLIVYGAAGVGWLLVFVAPMISQMLINAMHQRQIGRLERQQRILVEEWGSELEAYLKPEPTKALEAQKS